LPLYTRYHGSSVSGVQSTSHGLLQLDLSPSKEGTRLPCRIWTDPK
jgi:hypothetical protein